MFDLNKNPKVFELIQSAENEELFLPEFQREFVWDKTQIKLLVDSLYNDYTINSILTWGGTDELARRRIGGSIKEIKIPQFSGSNVSYLLDGQQRATALLLAFTMKPVYKRKNTRKKEIIELYFNSEYDGDDPELRFFYGDESIVLNGKEICLDEYSDEEFYSKFASRFVCLSDIYLDLSDSNHFNKLQKLLGNNFIEYYKKIRDLREKILNKEIVNINQEGDLHSVLNIFERINTLNTKLNIFDIMIAKTYKKIEDEYFDLRTFLRIMNYDGQIKSDYLENKQEIDIDSIKIDQYLDEATQLFLIMEILNKKFKQKNILDISTESLLNNMKKIHKLYWSVIKFVENRFKVSRNNLSEIRPILKFLTAYLSTYDSLSLRQEQFLTKWFWNTLLYNRYPGAQNERVQRDYDITQENNFDKALEIFKKERTRNFNENDFDAYYGTRSQLFDALSILFISNGVQDFYNGLVAQRQSSSSDKLEEHHIFPLKSKIGKKIAQETDGTENEGIIDNIANLAFITKETNNNRIKNKEPRDYISEFEEEYIKIGKLDEFKSIMKSQFISEDMIEDLKNNDFFKFVDKRTKLIKLKINELCE